MNILFLVVAFCSFLLAFFSRNAEHLKQAKNLKKANHETWNRGYKRRKVFEHFRACVMTCSSEDTLSRYTPFILLFGRGMHLLLNVMLGAQEPASFSYGDCGLQFKTRLSNSYDDVRDQFMAVQHRQKDYSDWEMKANLYQPGDFIFNRQIKKN